MNVIGSKKQEDKLEMLSVVAHDMFPELSPVAFKEGFRVGVETALKTRHYEQWSDVVTEQPAVRKAFFESVLEGMNVYLKQTGLNDSQIDRLCQKLNKKNRRFLG